MLLGVSDHAEIHDIYLYLAPSSAKLREFDLNSSEGQIASQTLKTVGFG